MKSVIFPSQPPHKKNKEGSDTRSIHGNLINSNRDMTKNGHIIISDLNKATKHYSTFFIDTLPAGLELDVKSGDN